jgi:phosphoribosyl 1,2-cyclic phosphodiesterase
MSAPAAPRDRVAGEGAVVDGPAFIRFWGVRGSIPVPGPDTVRYGGNTACVEFRGGGEIIILDSGTGIRPLGQALDAEFAGKALNLTLLITHSHWDHIQGFPFFRPAYEPGNHLRILGFEGTRDGLAGIFSTQMESPYFPIGLGELPGHLAFEELRTMEIAVGAVKVQAAFANHPGVCVGYRLNTRAGSVAYLPDHEPFHRMRNPHTVPDALRDQARDFARSEDEKIVRFLDGVDALILDAQFDADEYARHTGWGHSSVDDAVDLALRAKAKRLFLFHHDPAHSDDKMDQMVGHARKLAAKSGKGLEVEAAREGVKCELGTLARR